MRLSPQNKDARRCNSKVLSLPPGDAADREGIVEQITIFFLSSHQSRGGSPFLARDLNFSLEHVG